MLGQMGEIIGPVVQRQTNRILVIGLDQILKMSCSKRERRNL